MSDSVPMAAVAPLTLQAVAVDRLAGMAYPLWSVHAGARDRHGR